MVDHIRHRIQTRQGQIRELMQKRAKAKFVKKYADADDFRRQAKDLAISNRADRLTIHLTLQEGRRAIARFPEQLTILRQVCASQHDEPLTQPSLQLIGKEES